MTTRCPCGSDETYDQCCGRFHSGAAAAPTALQLMRSRYSAFAVSDPGYLSRTWHSSTRPAVIQLEDDMTWTGLEILDTVDGGPFDSQGVVEFRAHYRSGGARRARHERSNFIRQAGEWCYVSGTTSRPRRLGAH